MRRVGWRIMSVKLPLLAAALGLVRTISSTGTYFPFFLLASDRTFFASSMRDLAMSHLGDSGRKYRITDPTATMAEMAWRCRCQSLKPQAKPAMIRRHIGQE